MHKTQAVACLLGREHAVSGWGLLSSGIFSLIQTSLPWKILHADGCMRGSAASIWFGVPGDTLTNMRCASDQVWIDEMGGKGIFSRLTTTLLHFAKATAGRWVGELSALTSFAMCVR